MPKRWHFQNDKWKFEQICITQGLLGLELNDTWDSQNVPESHVEPLTIASFHVTKCTTFFLTMIASTSRHVNEIAI